MSNANLIAEARRNAPESVDESLIMRLVVALEKAEPRVIETAKELDAMPVGSVVSDSYSDVHEKIGRKWFQISDPDPFESGWLGFPATVLHEPTT